MPESNRDTIRLWQWPNVLALDAALIAVLWQAALASAMGLPVSTFAHLVLGLSVWLSYTADRLFDVGRREPGSLLSLRHRFAKRQRIRLWRVWLAILIGNLLAATQLSGTQLKHGGVLLLLCLLYTCLNQRFSKSFFPKELCVALLYAAGIVVFIPGSPPISFTILFAYLCLLNCLMIGTKETSVDAHLRVHSMANGVHGAYRSPLIWIGAAVVFLVETPLQGALVVSFVLLGSVHLLRKQLALEAFRVLADGVLLIAPILVLSTSPF